MIVCLSLTRKTPFEASLFLLGLMANQKEIVFHIILRPVLYRGSHVLQILLKAL